MSLVFDTSILIDIERSDYNTINKIKLLAKEYPSPASITFITYYEFLRGLKIGKPKNYDKLIKFIDKFSMLRITKKTADILSEIKIKYDNKEITLSLADLLIASQIIENKLILVTKDKDFEKIEELNKIIF